MYGKLGETEKAKRSLQSTQVQADGETAARVRTMQRVFDPGDLHENGIETDPHVTVLYGLDGVSPQQVQAIVGRFQPFDVTFGRTGLFENEEFDVVKVEAESPQLRELHAQLRRLPNQNERAVYQPHLTLAYVKKGVGSKYLIDPLNGRSMRVRYVVFSDEEGRKTVIPLGVKTDGEAETQKNTQCALCGSPSTETLYRATGGKFVSEKSPLAVCQKCGDRLRGLTTKPGGKSPGPSIKNPRVYEALIARGYSKSRAAAISNSMAMTSTKEMTAVSPLERAKQMMGRGMGRCALCPNRAQTAVELATGKQVNVCHKCAGRLQSVTTKHLPGKHNQASHAHGGKISLSNRSVSDKKTTSAIVGYIDANSDTKLNISQVKERVRNSARYGLYGKTSVPLKSLSVDDFQNVLRETTGRPRSKRPIVIDSNGYVIDGRHRVAMAIKNGETRIEAYAPITEKALLNYARSLLDGSLSPVSSFTVFKQADGQYRWVTRSSNAFRDRDGEIVSVKALAEDCARADTTKEYGTLRFWHMPGVDIGDCDFNSLHNRTLIESGTFRNPAVAERVASKAANYQISIGFRHPVDQPDENGVFQTIRRFERSLVPAGRAANPFTSLSVHKEKQHMDQTKIAALKALLDGDEAAVKEVLAGAEASEKTADQMGIAFKERSLNFASADELLEYAIQQKEAELNAADQPAEEQPTADESTKEGSPEKMSDEKPQKSEDYAMKMAGMVEKMGGYMARMEKMFGKTEKTADDVTAVNGAVNAHSNRLANVEETVKSLSEQLTSALKELDELKADVPPGLTGQKPSERTDNIVGNAEATKQNGAGQFDNFMDFVVEMGPEG